MEFKRLLFVPTQRSEKVKPNICKNDICGLKAPLMNFVEGLLLTFLGGVKPAAWWKARQIYGFVSD